MAKKKESDRGTSSVSVRLPNDLIEWIDKLAEKENRSRANTIETLLKRVRETQEGKK
jgi:predicted transcriptional regulator